MSWYVVHTRPRQEERALEHLQRQGFECYFPRLAIETLRKGALTTVLAALFPRYLFLRQDAARSIAPVRSTQGVNQLVRFGGRPALVADELVEALRSRETHATSPARLFVVGERLHIRDGTFAGFDALYQMPEGDRRSMVLIELMSCKTPLAVLNTSLRKVS